MKTKFILLTCLSLCLCACFPHMEPYHPSSSTSLNSSSTSDLYSSSTSSFDDSSSSTGSSSSTFSSSSEGPHSDLWDSSQDSLRTGIKTLNFYNFNDLHGATVFDTGAGEPGIRKLSSYLKEKRNLVGESNFVLTSSGDMWQGSADSNITKGELVTEWMNELGFSAMCIGNHEFDWKISTIQSNMELANFPIVACNIVDKNTNKPVDWVKPYTTITKNGVHIGIIGAIGQGLTADILASNVKDVIFPNPTSYIQQWSTFLKDNGADMIMLLLHDSAYNISYSLNGCVNLAFCGHTHTGENEIMAGNIPAVQAFSNGKDVAYIQMKYDFSNRESLCLDHRYITTFASTLSSYIDDPNTCAIYDKYSTIIDPIVNRVVSTYKSDINKNLIPDIYCCYAYKYFRDNKHDYDSLPIFAVETNNARANIQASSNGITYGAVYKALPFDNYLCLTTIKGRDVSKLVTYSSSYWYLPGVGSVNRSEVYSHIVNPDDYVYILSIDYIALGTFAPDSQTVLDTFTEEAALPREIFSTYLADYPGNFN